MVLMLYKWFFVFGFSFFAFKPSAEPAFISENTSSVHPFYLSVTEISHNTASKALEISCKMFADDLEAILEKNNGTTLDITTGKDKSSFDKYIPAYMANHLSIVVDGKPARLNYVVYEADKESAYVYLEVLLVPAARKIDVNNTLLHDFTSEQINILHVTVNGTRKSTKLVFPASQAGFSF